MNTRAIASSSPGLSVVFLTYNRSDLLEQAFRSIAPALRALPFSVETLISDDASEPSHQVRIRALAADQTLVAERNSGLSNNHNKALRACNATRVISLQDDWLFTGDPHVITEAMRILDEDPEVGMVNFLPTSVPIPCEHRCTSAGTAYLVYDNDGMSRLRASGSRPYTDRPHLKLRACIEDLGPYREDLPMTGAELEFQQRVACQTRWRIAWIVGTPAFEHIGETRTFNPGQLRAARIARWQALPVVGPPYRWLRQFARRVLRGAHTAD